MTTAFSFDQSMLFAPPEQPCGDAEMDMADSILFTEAKEVEPDFTVDCSFPKRKEVHLFNGKTLTLKPRRATAPVIDYADTILDMDILHERVKKSNSLRESQKLIRALQTSSVVKSDIWTEKYRPKTFMQLCSAGNERQYRMIMHWLRKWASVVFGQEKIDDDSTDALGRPHKKVLLVHGPSGVGKTASVHLLARQMGYAVQELNAANSMDVMTGVEHTDGAGRFANATAALKLKIKNALTTNSITSNGKPTCIVIDEIDCSINAGDIVRVINDLVAADVRSHRDGSTKKKFSLNRPIICIANDIYTPSVRSYGPNPMDKLRPLCEIVAFKRPVTGKTPGMKINSGAQKAVKEHLMAINQKEKLGLDSKEIGDVFEVCEGDIRACLNYMQFSSRKLEVAIHAVLPGSATKNKDKLVSSFNMVDRLFRRNPHASKDEDFDSLMELMLMGGGRSAAGGTLDKVIRGCFNKYLDVVHFQDDSLVKPAEISDWLFYYDSIAAKSGESSFYPSLAALKFWSLFSEINPRQTSNDMGLIPNVRGLEFELFELLKQNKAVVKKISDLLPVEMKLACCGTSGSHEFYACQFLPYLDAMLLPEIGSSKLKSSLKEHERQVVEKLADLTKKVDIRLETQRDLETNQVSLMFGPNWDSITAFESEFSAVPHLARTKTTHAKRLWLFPLIQAELETVVTAKAKRQISESPGPEKVKKARMGSSLDFFKNQYEQISTQLEPARNDHEVTRIWVKYNEGFSNAVRKNIGWRELWML